MGALLVTTKMMKRHSWNVRVDFLEGVKTAEERWWFYCYQSKTSTKLVKRRSETLKIQNMNIWKQKASYLVLVLFTLWKMQIMRVANGITYPHASPRCLDIFDCSIMFNELGQASKFVPRRTAAKALSSRFPVCCTGCISFFHWLQIIVR